MSRVDSSIKSYTLLKLVRFTGSGVGWIASLELPSHTRTYWLGISSVIRFTFTANLNRICTWCDQVYPFSSRPSLFNYYTIRIQFCSFSISLYFEKFSTWICRCKRDSKVSDSSRFWCFNSLYSLLKSVIERPMKPVLKISLLSQYCWYRNLSPVQQASHARARTFVLLLLPVDRRHPATVLLNALKTLYRLSRTLRSPEMHSTQRYKICTCLVIIEELESFRNYKGFSIIFPKTVLDAIKRITKVKLNFSNNS